MRCWSARLAVEVLSLSAVLSMTASTAVAQETVGEALSALILSESAPNPSLPKDVQAAMTTRDTVAQLVLVELSNLPIGSSAGGFVYRWNAGLGLVERASPSFGAFFTERALTSGRGVASLGLTVRGGTFNRLQGASLTSGTFPVNASRPAGSTQPNDIDTINLELSTQTWTGYGTFGITDRLDVGVAVPIVTLDVEGRRVNTFLGVSSLQAAGAKRATGVGDVAVRARYALIGEQAHGVTAGLDVRLPTGREEDLLGAGRASTRMFGIASFERGLVATHVNAGYTVGGVSREFGYNAAVTYAPLPRITFVGELLGRRLSNLHRLRDVYAPHPTMPGVETMRWLPQEKGVHQMLASTGMKVNITRSYVLNANMLIRLTDLGLSARVVPSISMDYTFDR
jgi:hypothetical protein